MARDVLAILRSGRFDGLFRATPQLIRLLALPRALGPGARDLRHLPGTRSMPGPSLRLAFQPPSSGSPLQTFRCPSSVPGKSVFPANPSLTDQGPFVCLSIQICCRRSEDQNYKFGAAVFGCNLCPHRQIPEGVWCRRAFRSGARSRARTHRVLHVFWKRSELGPATPDPST